MPKNPIISYKRYPFFDIPRPEDLSSPNSSSFKKLLRSVTPHKKLPLADFETFTQMHELDHSY